MKNEKEIRKNLETGALQTEYIMSIISRLIDKNNEFLNHFDNYIRNKQFLSLKDKHSDYITCYNKWERPCHSCLNKLITNEIIYYVKNVGCFCRECFENK